MSVGEMQRLALITPTEKYEADYRAFVEETYAIEGLFMRRAEEDFTAFVRQLAQESRGEGLSEGKVTQSTFWLVCDGVRLVGASRLRHNLTPALEEWGGHIGYNVRPSEWNKGYGTQLLAFTLAQARIIGLPHVLLMCYEDNIGSKRVIEKNGGILIGMATEAETNKQYLRYRIEL